MIVARRPNIFTSITHLKLPQDCVLFNNKYCCIMARYNKNTKSYKIPLPLPTKTDTSDLAQSSCSSGSVSGHNIPTLQNGTKKKESIYLKNVGSKRGDQIFNPSDNKRFAGDQNLSQFLPARQNFYHLPYLNSNRPTNHENYSRRCFNRANNWNGRDNSLQSNIKNNEERIGQSVRKWELTTLGKRLKKQNKNEGQEFTFMSYNVLAQDLLDQHPEIYKHHNRNHLHWPVRWGNLYNEISNHKPDILCLQEVQQIHLKGFYTKKFEELGYSGIYKKRTGAYTDGCAIFYNTKMFDMLESIKVEFKQSASHRLDRDNVGIIIKLAPKSNKSQQFIVATTHLLYNPKREDVRIAQIQLFLTEIERMAYNNRDEYLPIIISGDFNSEPQSSLLEFMSKSSLYYNNLPFKKKVNSEYWIPYNLGVTDSCQHVNLLSKRLEDMQLTRKEELNLISIRHETKQKVALNDNGNKKIFATGTLNHNFNFSSVYDYLNDDEMDGTTFQDRWICVDYIFYSAKNGDNGKKDDRLKLLSRYALPKCDELTGVHIPNNNLGSDHISLCAKFKLEF